MPFSNSRLRQDCNLKTGIRPSNNSKLVRKGKKRKKDCNQVMFNQSCVNSVKERKKAKVKVSVQARNRSVFFS